jgi:regulator of sirC expression with transglutaminase-like and TPR domain
MSWTVLTPIDYFAALVAEDAGFALTEVAVSLAQDECPELDVQSVLNELDGLAAQLRQRLPADASPVHKVRLLNHTFYEDLGFGSCDEDERRSDGSFVHEILIDRHGLPLTLALIYLELAGQIGLIADGVLFPDACLIKLRLPLGDAILDPATGISLSREALQDRFDRARQRGLAPIGSVLGDSLRAAQPRELIAHLLRHLETLYRQNQDWPRLLAVQERLVILLPQDWERRRDRGLTLARLGRIPAAIDDLSLYLRQRPTAPDCAGIRDRLRLLRDLQTPHSS